MSKGYVEHTRGNGSKWYLCDTCETVGFLTDTEEKMIKHVEARHRWPIASKVI